jgi:hypothetical protein
MANDGTARWVSLCVAAEILGLTPDALRKVVERNARRDENGVTAQFNGIQARKLGRHWRVYLSDAWREPELTMEGARGIVFARQASVRNDRKANRS